MKRKLTTKITLALLFVSIVPLATSCLKDGLKDFEGLRHPMQITGSFNPELGLPIGQASMNFADILGMFDAMGGIVDLDPNTGSAVLRYDTTFHITVDIESSNNNTKGRRGSKSSVVYRQDCSGYIDFDMFSNLDMLPANYRLEQVYMTLTTDILAHGTPRTQDLLANYDVLAYVDNLVIRAVNSTTGQYYEIPIQYDSIAVNNLMTGDHMLVVDSVEASQFLNIHPDRISYSARFNLDFGTRFWASDITEFINDSLGISTIDLDNNIRIYSPLTIYFENAVYGSDIALNNDENSIINQLQVDSSYLVFEFVNGMPLQLDIEATLRDEGDNVLSTLISNAMGKLHAANIAYNSNTNSYTASAPTTSIIQVPITNDRLRALATAKNIHLETSLSTAPDQTGNVNQPAVSILDTDELSVRIYAMIHPNLTITLPLTFDTVIISK